MEQDLASANGITVVAIACLILWLFTEEVIHRFGFRQPKGANREWMSSIGIVVSFSFVAAFSSLDAVYLRWTSNVMPESLRAMGLILLVAGVAVRISTRLYLGRHFSGFVQTSDAHRLITSGIYRYIRHPAYLGTLLLLIGFPLALRSAGGLACAIALGIPAMAYRMRVEERALLQWFGEDYATYQARTSKVVPHVW